MAEELGFRNKNGGVRWELLVSNRQGVRSWATLPDDTCAVIEAAKAAGRPSVLMNDEKGRMSRALIADYEECLETIGGELRRLRRRELPPLVLPSEVVVPPARIVHSHPPGKAKPLSLREQYAVARTQIFRDELGGPGGGEGSSQLSVTKLVSSRKHMKHQREAAKRKSIEARNAQRALSGHGSSRRTSRLGSTGGGSETTKFSGLSHAAAADERFQLSLQPTALPKKVTFGWVLKGLGESLAPSLFEPRKNKAKDAKAEAARLAMLARRRKLGASASVATTIDPSNSAVARARFAHAVAWKLARERGRSQSGRTKAARLIQQEYRVYLAHKGRHAAARVLQRCWRRRALGRLLAKQRRKAAKQRKKAAKEAAAAKAKQGWTAAQKGVLVALELVYGPPMHHGAWEVRAKFLGGAAANAAAEKQAAAAAKRAQARRVHRKRLQEKQRRKRAAAAASKMSGSGSSTKKGSSVRGGEAGSEAGGDAGGDGGSGNGGDNNNSGSGSGSESEASWSSNTSDEDEHGGVDPDEVAWAKLRAQIPGEGKTVKNIQLLWEELHATQQLHDVSLLRSVPPPVLEAILPAWNPAANSKDTSILGSHERAHKAALKAHHASASHAGSTVEMSKVPDQGAVASAQLEEGKQGQVHHSSQQHQLVLPPPKPPVDGAIPLFHEAIPEALTSMAHMHAAEAEHAARTKKHRHSHHHHHHHHHRRHHHHRDATTEHSGHNRYSDADA